MSSFEQQQTEDAVADAAEPQTSPTTAAPTGYELPPQIQSLLAQDQQAVQVFNADYDAEGVWFYQAYKAEIGDYALQHQSFANCPAFNPTRMTWIKPSLGWMLYRCGYGRKPGQERVLRIKIPHKAVAEIMQYCRLSSEEGGGAASSSKPSPSKEAKGKKAKQQGEKTESDKDVESDGNMSQAPKRGMIQWDPERDVIMPEDSKGKTEPRKMLRTRAIQIGLAGGLSEFYVRSIIKIEDYTGLAAQVGEAHDLYRGRKTKEQAEERMKSMTLPVERGYLPACGEACLVKLGMVPGEPAEWLRGVGRGHI